MNKKGFVTPLLVFGIMISTSLFLAISYKSVAINNVRVKETETNIEELINVRTAYERIDGVLLTSLVQPGVVEFDDIDKSIKIDEVGRTDTTLTMRLVVIDNDTKVEFRGMNREITINVPKKENELSDGDSNDKDIGNVNK